MPLTSSSESEFRSDFSALATVTLHASQFATFNRNVVPSHVAHCQKSVVRRVSNKEETLFSHLDGSEGSRFPHDSEESCCDTGLKIEL